MLIHYMNSEVSDAGSFCLWGGVSTPLKMQGYLQADWLRAGGPVVNNLVGGQDPLEEEMATHSSILARRIPWTEEPARL